MSENKIIKAWGAGCARQTFLAIIIFVVVMVVFLGLVILAVLLPIPNSQRINIWLGGFSIFLLLMTAGLLTWGAWSIGRHTAQLDAAFAPLGLIRNAYLWNGRQYHGIVNGRQIDAYFFRGPSLAIYVASPLNTRMGVGTKGRFSQMISRAYNRPELVTNDPELAHLGIYPLDEQWGRELLDNPPARAAILRLTEAQSDFELRNLLFQPEAIQLQIRRIKLTSITAESIRNWVNDLLDLAGIAESLPAPNVTATASALERRTRLNRSDFTLPIMGITCGIIGFFAAIFIIITVVFINLGRGVF